MPASFKPDPPADVWLPLQADPSSTNQGHYLSVAGRLKPGVTVEAANAELRLLGEQFRKANPKWMDKSESVAAVPMREATIGNVKTALFILLGAVAFVLLIACANVANLLLARAATRQKELAIRAAVGASRWRVIRQLLTESVLLAGVGGLLGFLLGAWGVRALLLLAPGNIPRLTASEGTRAVVPFLDWRIAAFAIGISLLTGILFGLFPALQTSNPDVASILKEASGRSATGLRQNRMRGLLVITEMMLALVLLVGASLLIRTFLGLRTADAGINAHNVLTFQTSLSGGRYGSTSKVTNFNTQVTRRIENLPGVSAASSAIVLPTQSEIDLPFTIAGKPPAKGSQYNGDVQWRFISPHYFSVFGIPVLRGRVFTETDTQNAAQSVIINQTMAKKYWPKEDPLGAVITIGKGLGPQFADPPRQIVGIVETYAKPAWATPTFRRCTSRKARFRGIDHPGKQHSPAIMGRSYRRGSKVAQRSDPAGGSRGRWANARRADPYHGTGFGRRDFPSELQHAVAEHLRRDRAAARRYWHLRHHGLLRRAAHARNGHPNGFRR